jgi:molybdopterin molybdotransferase
MLSMNRCDTTPLLAYEDALAQLTGSVGPLAAVTEVPLLQATGRVLANSIEAAIDVPGCAMSAMDGYAINTADLAADVADAMII